MMEESPSKLNMGASLPTLPPIDSTSLKRPAPSLLPAFEPLSSSPGFPRPAKRQCSPNRGGSGAGYTKYPTPMPTSTTGIMSSSPPRLAQARPFVLQRTTSTTSERAPMGDIHTIHLPKNGTEYFMGRSSNSSHYQLSANKLISRVHAVARYIPETGSQPDKIEITCLGWNGMKVHCHGRSWNLAKGDSFSSSTIQANVMLDIQDARVIIGWPEHRAPSTAPGTEDEESEESESWNGDEEDEKSPIKAINGLGIIVPSNQRGGRRIRSPVSPTPAGPVQGATVNELFGSKKTEVDPNATIQIFEDVDSDNEAPVADARDTAPFEDVSASQSGSISENENEDDPNEENDPIIHSFGPFGGNISSRMASFTHGTPEPESDQAYENSSAPSSPSPEKRMKTGPVVSKLEPIEEKDEAEEEKQAMDIDDKPKPYVGHAINQLAYSRLSSTPLSVIMQNLPKELRGISDEQPEVRGLSKSELHRALMATACIGEIRREGKDAAGKPLESEYYYIPDMDDDEARRATVVDGLRKPSLRACRKQHKQYYWKKPRTP